MEVVLSEPIYAVKCLVHKRFPFSSGGIRLVAKVKFKLSVEKITFEYEGDHDTGLAVNRAINHTLGSLVEAQNQVIDVTPREVERASMPAVTALPSPSARRRHRGRPKPPMSRASRGETTEMDGESISVKPLRARRARGDSLRNQIYVLLQERYFSKPRRANEIRDEVSRRGHNFDPKNVASDLLWFVRKNYLSRQLDEDSVYVYLKGSKDDFPRSQGHY